MRNLSRTMLAVLATGLISCALFSQQAQAVTISGTITFGGSVKMNGNANTATTITAWLNSTSRALRRLAGFLSTNDPATFTAPWVFANAMPVLWTAGGFTFSLDAGSTVVQGGGFLNISGTGRLQEMASIRLVARLLSRLKTLALKARSPSQREQRRFRMVVPRLLCSGLRWLE